MSLETYRTFLGSIIAGQLHKPSFSYRSLAKKAGFGSPNQVQQILCGERKLTTESAVSLAQALKLTADESNRLIYLVMIEHGTAADKVEAHRALDLIFASKQIQNFGSDKTVFVSSWYSPIIWSLAPFLDANNATEQLFVSFHKVVPRSILENTLSKMLNEGILSKNSQNQYTWNAQMIEVKSEYFKDKLDSFYASCLTASRALIKKLSKKERHVRSTTFAIDPLRYPELVEKIRTFHLEILGWSETHKNPTSAVQFNTFLAHFGLSSE